MAQLSDFAENLLVDWLMTGATVTRPTTWFVALFTTAPNDTGGGVEVSGGGYARSAVTFAPSSGGQSVNSADVSYSATADWGTVTHAAIFDAASGGGILWHGAFISQRTVLDGDNFTIPTGGLVVSITNAISNYARKLVLDWLMTTATVVRPGSLYLALFTTAPTDAGGGTEVSGGGYNRQAVSFGAASGGLSASTNTQVFGATADWGVVSHAAIFDAASGGNLIWHGAQAAARSVGNGDTLTYPAGAVTVSLA